MGPACQTVKVSPSFMSFCGSLNQPMPSGVPKRITEPLGRVVPWDRYAMVARTLKM